MGVQFVARFEQDVHPFTMIIFGATGDLAKRKLFPAFYGLYRNGLLGERFAVIGTGRSRKSLTDFRTTVRESVETYGRLPIDDERGWGEFISHFDYVSVDVKDVHTYQSLYAAVTEKESTYEIPGNRMFYLAIAPDLFSPVSTNLKLSGLTDTAGWKRLIIEKPFGHDYESAKQLNEQIQQTFSEREIYRIDHYLGKEMVQNIEVIRFANTMFEPLWNNRYIDNIQINASETVGVEERAAYYDRSGALRDMVQNHILQMLMMICMEPSSRFHTEAVRDEKVKVLRSLRRYSEEEVKQHVVRGQYTRGAVRGKEVPGYREEAGVSPDSATETFVAAKLFVDNFRWAGVPIYIRTGKRMPQKSTEIVIQFKEMPKNLLFNKNNDLGPNLLIIRINPIEGIDLMLNAKKPGADDDVIPISMEYCNNCDTDSPEAYERLMHDAIQGDSTFFTGWDEVSLAWKFVDPIRRVWDKEAGSLHLYEAGTWGPVQAKDLLAEDKKQWWFAQGQKLSQVVQAVEQPDVLVRG